MPNRRFDEARRLRAGGHFERAVDILQELTNEEPGLVDAHVELAFCYGLMGDLPNAELWARSAISLNRNSGFGHFYLGRALEDQGRDLENSNDPSGYLDKLSEAFVHMERGWALSVLGLGFSLFVLRQMLKARIFNWY